MSGRFESSYSESSEPLADFSDQLDNFFRDSPDVDWVMIADESRQIIDSGPAATEFSETEIAELETAFGEKLIVYHRPITPAGTL